MSKRADLRSLVLAYKFGIFREDDSGNLFLESYRVPRKFYTEPYDKANRNPFNMNDNEIVKMDNTLVEIHNMLTLNDGDEFRSYDLTNESSIDTAPVSSYMKKIKINNSDVFIVLCSRPVIFWMNKSAHFYILPDYPDSFDINSYGKDQCWGLGLIDSYPEYVSNTIKNDLVGNAKSRNYKDYVKSIKMGEEVSAVFVCGVFQYRRNAESSNLMVFMRRNDYDYATCHMHVLHNLFNGSVGYPFRYVPGADLAWRYQSVFANYLNKHIIDFSDKESADRHRNHLKTDLRPSDEEYEKFYEEISKDGFQIDDMLAEVNTKKASR